MLYKDIITVIDQAGTTRGQTRAVVDKDRIITKDVSLLIEEGDTIERDLPHGRKETFSAKHVQFYGGLGPGMKFYEVTTGKPNSFANRPSELGVSVYVTDSPHSRVNLNSVDSSNNVVSIRANEVFQQTRHLLETGVADSEERTALLQSVKEMEAAHVTQDFITKFKAGLCTFHRWTS